MQQAGLAAFEKRDEKNPLFMHMKIRTKNLLQSMKTIKRNRKAWDYFNSQRRGTEGRKSLGNNCKTESTASAGLKH